MSLEINNHPDINPSDWKDSLDAEIRSSLFYLVSATDLREEVETTYEEYLNKVENNAIREIKDWIDCQEKAEAVNNCLRFYLDEDAPEFRFEQKEEG